MTRLLGEEMKTMTKTWDGYFADRMDWDDRTATPAEACREYAYNAGSERQDDAWILTDWDTWEKNPHFHGPKCQALHPDDERHETDEFFELHADCKGTCRHGFGEPVFGPRYESALAGKGPVVVSDEDIPF